MRPPSERLEALHRLLDDVTTEREWLGDRESREELAAQWKLARHIATGSIEDRRKWVDNLEDLAESERRVRTDHTGRYPIELLQNAHDACADARIRGKAWFRVTSTALLVANQGVPFSARRIRSLIRLGGSSKKPGDAKHHTIGYKGIGFTSAFEISDAPQIISDGVAFRLDPRLAVQELENVLDVEVSRAPARYFPFPAAPSDWSDDAEEIEELLTDGAVTVVRLPFIQSVEPSEVASSVGEALGPTTLLTMPALDVLDLGSEGRWVKRRGRKLFGGQLQTVSSESEESGSTTWLVVDRRVPVDTATVRALEDPVWSDVKDLQVLVGIPWKRGRPNADSEDPPVHAYFPTDESIGRGILVHGDFFLESNRRHIQKEGAGGKVSQRVAEGVAETIGSLAETIARESPQVMPALLACLAPSEEPQGFGHSIAELLDEALSERPILRSVAGETLVPSTARILGCELPSNEGDDLAAMLSKVPRLVHPDYERAAGHYMKRLGASVVSASEIARRLDAGAAPTYERAVLATAAWWRAVPRWTERGALSAARLLKGVDGRWHVAAELCEPVADVPTLPPGLERATYRPPRSAKAAAFLREELGVATLDLERSLDIVLTAIGDGRYGRNADESRAAHDFVLSVFRRRKAAVRAHDDRGLVPVPVRAWRRGSGSDWRPAAETYFSREWNGHSDLENLYRRFSEREFLATEPPQGARKRRLLTEFYTTLGVASEPRTVAWDGSLWQAPAGWRQHEDVKNAERCPDDHPQTTRDFETAALDRLEELLPDIDVNEARALVSILSRADAPYGSPAKVWCTHSQHRKFVKQPAIGFQRWLLESSAWVPVAGGPTGQVLMKPGEAWVDVNGKALQAVLPQAQVGRAAAKFELPTATRPEPAQLADALATLRQAYPDLSVAPSDVVEGATHLLKKLEAALHRSKGWAPKRVLQTLPAQHAGEPRWSYRPAVQDVRLPSSLPLDMLPFGAWTELARAFSLPAASESVRIATSTENASPATLLGLEFDDKVNLLALLAAKGGDLKALAARLGRLEVLRCDVIETTFAIKGVTETEVRQAHLEAEASRARLFVADPVTDDGRAEVARLLAEYGGAESHREAILLYLVAGPNVLLAFDIGASALDEARAAITRYRREEEEAPPAPAEEQPPRKRDKEPVDSPTTAQEPRDPKAGAAPFPPQIRTAYSPPVGNQSGPADELPPLETVSFGDTEAPRRTKDSGVRPTGARGGTGSSGYASVSGEMRRAVERRAIEVAMKFALENYDCTGVRDVQEENKGWDLEVVDDGGWWPLEVKGFGAGVTAFILSRNELRAAKSRSDYRLLLVTGVAGQSGEIVELVNPGAWLSEEQLEPMSWAIVNWTERVSERHGWTAT